MSKPNQFVFVRRSVVGFAAAISVLVLAACAGAPDGEEDTSASSDESAITTGDIIKRADDFVAAHVLYCQASAGEEYDGPEACYPGVACPEQPGRPWQGYRTDCSGFVSYVWQIPSDPDTASYSSHNESGSQGWTAIPFSSLRAGDAVVTDGHIKLFSSVSGNEMTIYEEYDCNKYGRKATESFERSGDEIRFTDGNDYRWYHAIRRNALTPTPVPPPVKPGPPTPKPKQPTGCGEIQSGDGLAPGRAIRSCDKRFELVLQGDGNLVEYGPLGALWSTETSGKGGFAADMQADGNFVLYNKTSNSLFNTHTNGDKGAYLALQNDGNIVIRGAGGKAEWNAGVSFTGGVAEATGCGEIKEGFGLVAGQSIESCGKKYRLVMQSDGNLVYYRGATAVWSSKTNGEHGYKAQMQADGNFVVYDEHAKALWSTSTSGHANSFFALQDDGNLVVYAPGNHAVWASK